MGCYSVWKLGSSANALIYITNENFRCCIFRLKMDVKNKTILTCFCFLFRAEQAVWCLSAHFSEVIQTLCWNSRRETSNSWLLACPRPSHTHRHTHTHHMLAHRQHTPRSRLTAGPFMARALMDGEKSGFVCTHI